MSQQLKADRNDIQSNDIYDTISVNNVTMWFSNNGNMSYDPTAAGNGFKWPKGSGKSLIFEEGLIYGGMIQGIPHVGGSTYRQGLQAGTIKPDGTANNPSDPRFRIYKARIMSAMEFNAFPPDVRARLRRDFMEWPVDDGARWIDSNQNGRYDPDFDAWLSDSTSSDKPWFIGDEMLWFVSNDLDPARTSNLYGTTPVGLEIQTYVWAYNRPGVLQNSVFVKHTMINKGRGDFENLYIGRWADPDLGKMEDDFIGFDSTRQMMYLYNGKGRDSVYGVPPAHAQVLLQGPTISSPTGTARLNFETRSGMKNLDFSSFTFYVNSSSTYRDPSLGTPQGAIEMYNNLQGMLWNGNPHIDPGSNVVTKTSLAGDPLTRTGWIDGLLYPAEDRRMIAACGPLALAKGDTQEIVIGNVAVQGTSRLGSVVELRSAAEFLHSFYRTVPNKLQTPESTVDVSYPTNDDAKIQLTVNAKDARSVEGIIRSKDGTELGRFLLYDDGQHNDGAANDFVFGGEWTSSRSAGGVDCFFVLDKNTARESEWTAKRCIPLTGKVRASLKAIESDHLNYDFAANPGENIRMSVRLHNQTTFTLGPWRIREDGFDPGDPDMIILENAIATGLFGHRPYEPRNRDTYFSHDVPANTPDNWTLQLPVEVRDLSNNCWCDSLAVTVRHPTVAPFDSLTKHIAGPATGTLGWRRENRFTLKDHTYRITIQGRDNEQKTFAVFDIPGQQLVLQNEAIPDWYAHETPVTDGWKLTSGTAFEGQLDDEGKPLFPDPVQVRYQPPDRTWLSSQFPWMFGVEFFGSKIPFFDLIPVKLVFDNTKTQKAYNYLRGGSPSYAYQGYFDVPMRAYDISDSLNPRQLNIAFVEQNLGPAHNQKWDPKNAADREYLFIMKSTYSDKADTMYTNKRLVNDAPQMDILYGSWLYPSSPGATFTNGDHYLLIPRIPVSVRDTFIINPLGIINSVGNAPVIRTLALSAFPNPLISQTTIMFSLPESGEVRLRVCDLLGRTVATLVHDQRDAGEYSIRFKPSLSLANGTYQLILQANGQQQIMPILILR